MFTSFATHLAERQSGIIWHIEQMTEHTETGVADIEATEAGVTARGKKVPYIYIWCWQLRRKEFVWLIQLSKNSGCCLRGALSTVCTLHSQQPLLISPNPRGDPSSMVHCMFD
jgi:hypothetical protein